MTEIFAHRGLHLTETENTIAAFLAAKVAGAHGVELDVRRTKDGALVIHHDAVIEGVGAITEVTCRELPDGVATLEEAMTACSGLRVNVEIKNDPREPGFDASGALAHQIVAFLTERSWLQTVIISSFDLATCEAARLADADVQVGWLLDWRVEPETSIQQVRERGLNAIHPFFARTNAALVADAHERGIAVNVWTVNGTEDMVRMFGYDVDTLITDDPALALEMLERTPPAG